MKISLIRIAESNLLAAKLAIRYFFKIMGKNYMVPNAFALDVLIDLFFLALESIPKNFENLFFASFPSVLRREGFIERNLLISSCVKF